MSTYIVKSLPHAKLLTDPFKLQLLERFGGKPVTTKQVADDMGEKAPRLYRHVDAMVDAGFLELVEEKQKRGTVERYYKTVASRFEVDPNLFSPSSDHSDEAFGMVRSLLRETESDLHHISALDQDDLPKGAEDPIVMRFSIQASKDEISLIKSKLDEWLADIQTLADTNASAESSEDEVNYAGLVTFYPLPADKPGLPADSESQNQE
jgi:hypothetical protein